MISFLNTPYFIYFQLIFSFSIKQIGRAEQTAEIYVRTSTLWGLRGDIVRVGEFLCKAAREVKFQKRFIPS